MNVINSGFVDTKVGSILVAQPETLIGRRDFEVVAFADYQHDMDELGSRSAEIIKQQRKEICQLRWALWQAAKQNGGELKLPEVRRQICTYEEARLETTYCEYDRTIRIRSLE